MNCAGASTLRLSRPDLNLAPPGISSVSSCGRTEGLMTLGKHGESRLSGGSLLPPPLFLLKILQLAMLACDRSCGYPLEDGCS